MRPKRKRTRSVEIVVTREQIAFWTCAAALDPVPPTWLGPTWRELLQAPVDPSQSSKTIAFPTSVLAEFRSRDDRATMHFVLPMIITDHALSILERHGLQPIPSHYCRTTMRAADDDIPF